MKAITLLSGGMDSVTALYPAHSGDHAIYPDCRESFMLAMADAMKHGTYPGIQLLRPFIATIVSEPR
jgi:7-cyano-7-deazaguanine synthase in queuosine biosynthesis